MTSIIHQAAFAYVCGTCDGDEWRQTRAIARLSGIYDTLKALGRLSIWTMAYNTLNDMPLEPTFMDRRAMADIMDTVASKSK